MLIFANEANEQLAQQQLDLLDKFAAGVKERAIKTTFIENESPLIKKYRVDKAQYTVIPVGQDGFEKYRTNKIIEIDKLFSIIDAMRCYAFA